MTSNIYLIYSLIITYNVVHLARSMTIPEFGNFTEESVNLDEVNDDDLLKQIYKDIDKYTKNTYVTKKYIMNIKWSLEDTKGDIVTKANVFMNEVESAEFVFQETMPTYYNDHDCIHYGRNCRGNEEVLDECSRNLLNKTEYIKSINIFIDLLFIDFNDKLHNFDTQLKELSRELGIMKMLAYLKYTGYKLNGTDFIESKMEEWKNATFKELDNQQMKLLEKANELISVFKTLSRKETNFEKEILKEINETKLSYGCCVKKFKFEIEGLECESTPSRNVTIYGLHGLKSFNRFRI